MKNFIKKHWLVSSILFVALAASAAKIGDDLLKIGKPGSTGDKSIVFDVGDGATNPSIIVDNTDKDFDFNKAMNIAGNLLKVGDGTNIDKDIIFDIGNGATNPRFRWNSTNNILEFSVDGSSFKKIGSGAGGASGVNVLADNNSDFETGTPPTDWTASGGTFIAETTAPLFGAQSGSWDASALAQTLDSVLGTITTGFLGNTCQAEISYLYAAGAAGDYKMVVRQFDDSGASEITVAELDLQVTATKKAAQIQFDCPDDVADDLRVRVEAGVADPGIIIVDDAFIGTGRNTFQIDTAAFVGGISHAASVTNCIASIASHVSGIYEPLAADGDCNNWTALGTNTDAALSVDGVADFTINNLPPGEYFAIVDVTLDSTTQTDGNYSCLWSLEVDGSRYGQTSQISNQTAAVTAPNNTTTFTAPFTVAATKDVRIILKGRQPGGTAPRCAFRGDLNDVDLNAIKVYKMPGQTAQAITLETSGWFVDAKIFGANIALSNANLSTYAAPGDSSLTIETRPGSVPVQIACLGAEAEGVNCNVAAVPEAAGIAVEIPTPGLYQFCAQGNYFADYDNDSYDITFQLHETDTVLGDNTIIQEGGGNQFFRRAPGLSGSQAYGLHLCGTFNFSTPGKKTIKIMREQLFSGSPNGHFIMADRDGNTGQRDLQFYGYKLNEAMPTPIFTDLQNSLKLRPLTTSTNQQRLEHAIVDCSVGGCTVTGSTSGSWISSVTRIGTGNYTVNYAQAFSVAPSCAVAPWVQLTGSCSETRITLSQTTNMTLNTFISAGTNQDCGFQIICAGQN